MTPLAFRFPLESLIQFRKFLAEVIQPIARPSILWSSVFHRIW